MMITRKHALYFHFNFNPSDYWFSIAFIRALSIPTQYYLYDGARRSMANGCDYTNEGFYVPCVLYAVNPIVKRQPIDKEK